MDTARRLILGAALATIAIYTLAHSLSAGWIWQDNVLRSMRGDWSWTLPNNALAGLSFSLTPDVPWMVYSVSLAIHLINVTLLWSLVRAVHDELIASCAAALFALHPLATQAVAYAAGRAELLAGTALLCVLVGLWTPRSTAWRWTLIAIGCAMALTTKPTVIVEMAPLAWWLARARRPAHLRGLAPALVGGAALAAACILRIWLRPALGPRIALPRWFALQAVGGWTLLGNAFVPWHLSIVHPWMLSADTAQCAAVLSLFALVLAIDRHLVNGFALGWWWIALTPRLVTPETQGYLREHHVYRALIGICWGIPLAVRTLSWHWTILRSASRTPFLARETA